jgi:hypothetical protein
MLCAGRGFVAGSLLLISFGLAACGGSGTVAPVSHERMPFAVASAAPPLGTSAADAQHVRSDSMMAFRHDMAAPSARYLFREGKRVALSAGGRAALNNVVTGADQGGQAQVIFPNSTAYSANYASESAWPDYRVDSGDTLYAPTMKAPGNGCTEITTVYTSGVAEVGVWDFCIPNNGVFHNVRPMNGLFQSYYVRTIDGWPRYTVENVNSGGTWQALIYNYTSNAWEQLYSSASGAACQGASPIPCGNGWNIFETHYPLGGHCTMMPMHSQIGQPFYSGMSASAIQLLQGSTWVYADTTNSYTYVFGDCFATQPYPQNPYTFDLYYNNYKWDVIGGW